MTKRITRRHLSTLLLVCGLMLSFQVAVLASPNLSGEFTSSLFVGFPAPSTLSGQQEVGLSLEKNLDKSRVFLKVQGKHTWPEQAGDKGWYLGLDEAYLDYYGDHFDLRIGKQRFNWGTALQVNPTDVLNPIQISNPLGEKLPVYGVNLDYYLGDTFKVTGVYVPFFKAALEAIPGQPQIEVIKPTPSFENSEYALKVSVMGLQGVDFSLSYFRGKEDLPSLFIHQGQPKAHYRDVQIVGFDVATTFGGVGVWGEGAYSIPAQGDAYFQGIIGADYGLDNGMVMMLQYLHQRKDQKSTNLLLAGINQDLGLYGWRMGAVYNLGVGSLMLNPEVNFSVAEATSFVVGGRYFVNKNGPVGMLPQEKNQLYVQVKASF